MIIDNFLVDDGDHEPADREYVNNSTGSVSTRESEESHAYLQDIAREIDVRDRAQRNNGMPTVPVKDIAAALKGPAEALKTVPQSMWMLKTRVSLLFNVVCYSMSAMLY